MISQICGHLSAMAAILWAIAFWEITPKRLREISLALILSTLFLTVLL